MYFCVQHSFTTRNISDHPYDLGIAGVGVRLETAFWKNNLIMFFAYALGPLHVTRKIFRVGSPVTRKIFACGTLDPCFPL